jgi:hypothetical protein
MNPPRSSTETLIKALRILSVDIESEDGAANAAIAEAADRLEELHNSIPVVKIIETESWDPRECWMVEMNGLNMGVYFSEDRAVSYADSLRNALSSDREAHDQSRSGD